MRPATNSMPLHTKSVRCTGKEMSLLECSYRKNDTHNNHFEDIGVQCKKRKNTASSLTNTECFVVCS